MVAVTDTQLDLENKRKCTGFDLESRKHHTPRLFIGQVSTGPREQRELSAL